MDLVNFNEARDLIKSFVKNPESINWGNEIKTFNQILIKYPEKSFWLQLNIGFKLNSICWFKSKDGKKFLNKEYNSFKLFNSNKEEYKLDDKTLIKIESIKKPKNLIELLDN